VNASVAGRGEVAEGGLSISAAALFARHFNRSMGGRSKASARAPDTLQPNTSRPGPLSSATFGRPQRDPDKRGTAFVHPHQRPDAPMAEVRSPSVRLTTTIIRIWFRLLAAAE
jgi:hypothetical protein